MSRCRWSEVAAHKLLRKIIWAPHQVEVCQCGMHRVHQPFSRDKWFLHHPRTANVQELLIIFDVGSQNFLHGCLKRQFSMSVGLIITRSSKAAVLMVLTSTVAPRSLLPLVKAGFCLGGYRGQLDCGFLHPWFKRSLFQRF